MAMLLHCHLWVSKVRCSMYDKQSSIGSPPNPVAVAHQMRGRDHSPRCCTVFWIGMKTTEESKWKGQTMKVFQVLGWYPKWRICSCSCVKEL